MKNQKTHVIFARSTVSPCFLIIAEGTTKAQAWEEAIGEKPWNSRQKERAQRYWHQEMTAEEIEKISNHANSCL